MEGQIRRRLLGQVVVVTGASAGVGRAVALAASDQGASVALIARSSDALTQVAREIELRGSEALALPLDISDAAAVEAAVDEIETRLGPIDVWINNAMVTVFSPAIELKPEELAQVTGVTYLGAVHGTLAAIRRMIPRNRGCVVQVGSALAFRGIPLQAAYCGAKHALRGFTASLRSELLHQGSDVRLTEVHLPAINTPQFDWARARAPCRPQPVGAIHAPELAAKAVIHAALHPRREYWLGGSTLQTILGQSVSPWLMDRLMARTAWSGQLSDTPADPGRPDNLTAPVPGQHRTHGRFVEEERERALLLTGETARLGVIAAGAAAFTLLGILVSGGWTKSPGQERRRTG